MAESSAPADAVIFTDEHGRLFTDEHGQHLKDERGPLTDTSAPKKDSI